MWEADDVGRSIRRYLALLLDDDWNVRLERREVRDEERPVAVVEVGPEFTLKAREAITQGNIELLYPVTVNLYPPLPDEDADEDALRVAAHQAAKLKSLINRWLTIGLTVRDKAGKQWSGPARIPLWDYEGVPLSGPDRAGPDDPHDCLWVGEGAGGTASSRSFARSTIGASAIQDTEDLRRWSVIAEFRVTMEMPGRERDDSEKREVTEGLKGSYVPPPG